MTEHIKTEEEQQKLEAAGVIRASRFIRKYSHSHKPITENTIHDIHKEIFQVAWPLIAGKYREENLEITYSKHLPPHFSEVPKLMKNLGDEFTSKILDLEQTEGILMNATDLTDEVESSINKIVTQAAWLHHKITFIHPFREGNGRTARLAANLILERYGLVGISIKIEKENKNRYRQALAQIDKENDYQPLIDIISEGLIDRYEGVNLKYYL